MLRGPQIDRHRRTFDDKTLLDALQRTAEEQPRRGIYFIDERGHQELRTYPQLLDSSRRVAAALQRKGLGPADRILFVMPTGFEFLSAFFGATAIGALPVPIAPPRPALTGSSDRAEFVLRISERLRTRAVLFDTREHDSVRPPQYKELQHVLDLGTLLEDVPVGAAPNLDAQARTLAYIQPTSGATGTRRAVELSHRNILTNIDAVGRHLGTHEDDIAASWLPLHSILGLVGVALFCTYWGTDAVLMHPDRFLKRPDEFLHLFGKHGATMSAAPSFGYHYCVRRCQESNLAGLDLSTWRVAMNGGEPIRVADMQAFRGRFGRYGFRDDAFIPVYGLTEATLAVSFGPVGAPPRTVTISRTLLERDGVANTAEAVSEDRLVSFVGSGTPLAGVDVMIIDERGIEVQDRVLGEIAVRGPNVTRGYFDQPKKRSAASRLSGEWLMTGDVGFVAEGELYVVGRKADLLSLADGRRVVAWELEAVIESIDGVRKGTAVLFTQKLDDGPRLVAALEIQSGADEEEIEPLVRSRLRRLAGQEPDIVCCLSPGSVPRSPTGKVRRHLVESLWEAGLLDRKDRNQEFDGVRRVLQRSRHEIMKLGQNVVGQIRRRLSPTEPE